jgi:hypothetical protein
MGLSGGYGGLPVSNVTPDLPPIAPVSQSGPFALVDLLNGRAYPLEPGPNSIGRSTSNRVVLADAAVSRRHAVLMIYATGECAVGDAGSRNGVFLNGQQVHGIGRLTPGGWLQIDGFRLLFTRNNATDPLPISFTDETLGVVVWNAADSCWYFGITLGVNRFVPAVYSPSDYTPPDRVPPPQAPEWEAVRACYRQVKAHEAEARARVGGQSSSRGRVRPHLTQVLFTPATATFVYEVDLTGAYCVTIDGAGAFVSGPVWIPSEPNDDN